MSTLRKNVAGQHVGFCLNSTAAGAPVTAGGAGNVVIDGGAQAACAGTFTHKGTGQWDYAPTQAETNGTAISFAFTGTGAIQVGILIYTLNYDTTAATVPTNVTAINGSANAALNLEENVENCPRGVCSGGTNTTAVVSSMTNPAALTTAGQLVGRTIIFDWDTATAALQSQASNITNSTTGATPTITFTALTAGAAPAAGDAFSIV